MSAHPLLGTLDRSVLEFNREFTRRSGGAVHDEDGLVMWAGAHPLPVLINGVARSAPGLSAAEAIERARAFFAPRGRGFTFWVRAHADADLEAVLPGAGFRFFGQEGGDPGMVVDHRLHDVPPPPGATLRRVTDEKGVADYAAVSAGAYATYGMPADVAPAIFARPEMLLGPDTYGVVAYEGEAPLAAAMVAPCAGMGQVAWVGTLPERRGRGLGEAVTRAVTNAAFDMGARCAGLTASPMGAPIYRRMGYVEITRYREYVKFSPDESQSVGT